MYAAGEQEQGGYRTGWMQQLAEYAGEERKERTISL
jgi:hypothetical protein